MNSFQDKLDILAFAYVERSCSIENTPVKNAQGHILLIYGKSIVGDNINYCIKFYLTEIMGASEISFPLNHELFLESLTKRYDIIKQNAFDHLLLKMKYEEFLAMATMENVLQ